MTPDSSSPRQTYTIEYDFPVTGKQRIGRYADLTMARINASLNAHLHARVLDYDTGEEIPACERHLWELTAYGRGDGFHYARRRSTDAVERHPDGQPCGCPNADAYTAPPA